MELSGIGIDKIELTLCLSANLIPLIHLNSFHIKY